MALLQWPPRKLYSRTQGRDLISSLHGVSLQYWASIGVNCQSFMDRFSPVCNVVTTPSFDTHELHADVLLLKINALRVFTWYSTSTPNHSVRVLAIFSWTHARKVFFPGFSLRESSGSLYGALLTLNNATDRLGRAA
jgi:hypothetical protein